MSHWGIIKIRINSAGSGVSWIVSAKGSRLNVSAFPWALVRLETKVYPESKPISGCVLKCDWELAFFHLVGLTEACDL